MRNKTICFLLIMFSFILFTIPAYASDIQAAKKSYYIITGPYDKDGNLIEHYQPVITVVNNKTTVTIDKVLDTLFHVVYYFAAFIFIPATITGTIFLLYLCMGLIPDLPLVRSQDKKSKGDYLQ